jgi:RNA polymerase sigma-70 factor (ECF subfamily)
VSSLSRAFLLGAKGAPSAAAHADAESSHAPELDSLEQRLEVLWQSGVEAWPGVSVDAETFVTRLGQHILPTGDPDGSPLSLLASVQGPDFYLACACTQGERRAIAAFDAYHLPEVPRFLAPLGRGDAFAAEVAQRLREKLFVAPEGEAPKIAEYNGRSAMGAWLRVIAVRTALSLLRREKSESAPRDEVRARAALAAPDPELDYVRARYGPEFREAFGATLASLDAEQKTLLRLHYIDGLTIDELGSIFALHRSTVARRIVQCRKAVLDDSARRISEKLALSESEVESLIRVLQSELEPGLEALLS